MRTSTWAISPWPSPISAIRLSCSPTIPGRMPCGLPRLGCQRPDQRRDCRRDTGHPARSQECGKLPAAGGLSPADRPGAGSAKRLRPGHPTGAGVGQGVLGASRDSAHAWAASAIARRLLQGHPAQSGGQRGVCVPGAILSGYGRPAAGHRRYQSGHADWTESGGSRKFVERGAEDDRYESGRRQRADVSTGAGTSAAPPWWRASKACSCPRR